MLQPGPGDLPFSRDGITTPLVENSMTSMELPNDADAGNIMFPFKRKLEDDQDITKNSDSTAKSLSEAPSPSGTMKSNKKISAATYSSYMSLLNKANITFDGNLDTMMYNWTPKERQRQRRLVQLWRQPQVNNIRCTFKAVDVADRALNSTIVSCIYWEEKQDFFITSVDCIYLLEALISVRFTVEEKNRIRRNLEGFRPLTVSKCKPDSSRFFKLIMSFPNPKPRNIEKDVKVFSWKILPYALKKIIGKYTASYGGMVGADNIRGLGNTNNMTPCTSTEIPAGTNSCSSNIMPSLSNEGPRLPTPQGLVYQQGAFDFGYPSYMLAGISSQPLSFPSHVSPSDLSQFDPSSMIMGDGSLDQGDMNHTPSILGDWANMYSYKGSGELEGMSMGGKNSTSSPHITSKCIGAESTTYMDIQDQNNNSFSGLDQSHISTHMLDAAVAAANESLIESSTDQKSRLNTLQHQTEDYMLSQFFNDPAAIATQDDTSMPQAASVSPLALNNDAIHSSINHPMRTSSAQTNSSSGSSNMGMMERSQALHTENIHIFMKAPPMSGPGMATFISADEQPFLTQ
ncbi:hypothetical protein H4219_003883 [Mycoemilia scoparia]|uniref:DUF7082 domain-containing protein n=1 Tax=Mycoemilia scoparia TaxID=417184 RepID=A0A9W8A2W8_9FUNG|nr:hypothetical protein H4219_003883 [Mycoemilia scoparia]